MLVGGKAKVEAKAEAQAKAEAKAKVEAKAEAQAKAPMRIRNSWGEQSWDLTLRRHLAGPSHAHRVVRVGPVATNTQS